MEISTSAEIPEGMMAMPKTVSLLLAFNLFVFTVSEKKLSHPALVGTQHTSIKILYW